MRLALRRCCFQAEACAASVSFSGGVEGPGQRPKAQERACCFRPALEKRCNRVAQAWAVAETPSAWPAVIGLCPPLLPLSARSPLSPATAARVSKASG